MKRFLLVGVLILSGCGSISTVGRHDAQIARQLESKGTYCNTLPRVYSGVAYDFCRLHARPSGFSSELVLGFYVFDIIASAAVDTLFLPYTGYRQYSEGNVHLKTPRKHKEVAF